MRYFSYEEPIWDDIDIVGNQTVTKSEDEIRAEYFPWWEARMIEIYGKEIYDRTYGFEDCLADWVINNWAWEVIE
jgi:hypothetical protein